MSSDEVIPDVNAIAAEDAPFLLERQGRKTQPFTAAQEAKMAAARDWPGTTVFRWAGGDSTVVQGAGCLSEA